MPHPAADHATAEPTARSSALFLRSNDMTILENREGSR